MVQNAVRIARKILPPSGKVQYKVIEKTSDFSYYAQIELSNVDGHLIKFNKTTILEYYNNKNIIEEHKQLLFLIQITLHEFAHTLTWNVIKGREQQEVVSEIVEQLFKNTIENIHYFPV